MEGAAGRGRAVGLLVVGIGIFPGTKFAAVVAAIFTGNTELSIVLIDPSC